MVGSHFVPLINWSLALVLHETLLTAAGAGLVATGRIRRASSLDRLWKGVLLAGMLSATLQSVCGLSLTTLPAIHQTTQLNDDVKRIVMLGGTHPSVVTTHHLAQTPGAFWPVLALLVWSAGSALRLALSLRAHRRFVSALRDRQRVTDPGLLRMATSLSDMAGLTTPPVLTSSEALRSPVVLSAREICLPSGITQVLDPVEMRLLLAHEMAHIGRGDLRWLLLANVLCCLLWFAPVYLFAERRRRDAAELCCDDWAARRAGDAYGMARCLVRVAQWTAIRQGSVGLALTGSSSISHRVERLLDAESRKCRIWPVALVLALLPLAALTPRVAPGDGLGSPHGALVHRVVQERVVVLRAPQQ